MLKFFWMRCARLVFLCIAMSGSVRPAAVAQSYHGPLRPLKVGDQLPDLLIKDIENYLKKDVSMSAFRGKYLLLDFWSSGCVSCYSGFKRLVGLQKRFEKDFQAILVNPYETKEEMRQRTARPSVAQTAYLPDLPSIVGDERWRRLFPFPTLGQQVWIDRDGKVIGISVPHNTNGRVIERLIKTGELDIFKASSFFLDLKTVRLKTVLDARRSDTTGHSAFSDIYTGEGSSIYGLQSGRVVDSLRGTVRYSFLNCSYDRLFYTAVQLAPEAASQHPRTTIFELSDPQYFLLPDNEEDMEGYFRRNVFCYEIELPLSQEAALPAIMWKELNQHIGQKLGINARVEVRPRLNRVLRIIDPAKLPASKGGKKMRQFPQKGIATATRYMNTPVKEVLNDIAASLMDREGLSGVKGYRPLPCVVEAETGISVDIAVESHLGRHAGRDYLSALQQFLGGFGIGMVEEYRPTTVLVYSDR
ncbi:TlpA family protein disulfide reductase [Chitinophaga lutea]